MNDLRQISAAVARPLTQLGRAAFRFVFPPSCPRCRREVEFEERDGRGRLIAPVLCHQCAADLLPPPSRRCVRCGLQVGSHAPTDGCSHCRSSKFRFRSVIRCGLYDDAMRSACIRAKSSTESPLAAALVNLLWLHARHELDSEQIDVVVAVPRHWTKRLLHRHHAAETLARVLARRLNKPHGRGLLRKIKWTLDQSDLTAAERKLNLKDAFAVWSRPRSLAGKTVLLVDDILTTGTTANECTRALLHAGATQVIVAVIAVVPPHAR